MWKQWVNAFLGLAVIAVPFMGFTGTTLSWTLAVMGAMVLAFSLWTTGEVSQQEYDEATAQHRRHSHA